LSGLFRVQAIRIRVLKNAEQSGVAASGLFFAASD
jgi:hypothetical protein